MLCNIQVDPNKSSEILFVMENEASRGPKIGHAFATTTGMKVGLTVYTDFTSESRNG